MSTTAEFVDRYTAVWNESDAGRRLKLITELWAEDGRYTNAEREFRGHAQVEAAVREAYDDFIVKGFTFKTHEFHEVQDAVRLVWHMVPAGGTDVVAVGTEFIVRGADGTIRIDYQFMDVNPA